MGTVPTRTPVSQARALRDTCAPGLSAITTQPGELTGGLALAGQRACSRVGAGHDLVTPGAPTLVTFRALTLVTLWPLTLVTC